MSNTIARRIDFLMRITDTRNSELGAVLSFDPSYISRIRTGSRGVPRHQPFIAPASRYFAERLVEPYQRNAVADAVCPGQVLPTSIDEISGLIQAWLANEPKAGSSIESLLVTLGSPVASLQADHASPNAHEVPPAAQASSMLSQTEVFLGRAGKREAVRRFLDELVAEEKAVQLLLHSDEGMAWLTEDRAFARQWALQLGALAACGSHIVAIHDMGRGIGEMLDAIALWMPLYLTGAIEPYWCPTARDRIFRESTFIARGSSAIFARSLAETDDGMANFLTHDPVAVTGLETEFAAFLKLCRPLMTITRYEGAEAMHEHLDGVKERLLAAGGKPTIAHILDDRSAALFAFGPQSFELLRFTPPYLGFAVTEHALAAPMWEHLLRSSEVALPACEIANRFSSKQVAPADSAR